MPTPRKKKKLLIDLKNNLQEKYVAFLDVMGFRNLVSSGRVDNLESYFDRILSVLADIKRDKASIESLMISDSIILISPDTKRGFIQLVTAIRRIQSTLLFKKILMRGAVSFGEVYYDQEKNIIVGKGYIRAFSLEREAHFPRVIIDPLIVKKLATDRADFLTQVNQSDEYNFEERSLYVHKKHTRLADDAIFIDYANRAVKKETINGNLKRVYEMITENLYTEQSLYSKYIWLRDYFYECLKLTQISIAEDESVSRRHKRNIEEWKDKFDRL
jgi:uncharacterized LabA/DUF88 family protein